MRGIAGVTRGQRLGFHLQINFGIDVGRIDGDVAEPRADGIDVHTGAKEMSGRRVADSMWADALSDQGRSFFAGSFRVPLD